ncbi:hypothetical protein MesoLjLc_78560 [Mesorhizobium sp. L-8-10]|nr:hypothetical protein MesoLjLb_78390 [Mesorhizobium sp. L-8-3]BCH35926.1 hypothetical protein MesoLjLc_78560 [Mesorhizobium sp. L-8-10]
MFAHPAGADAAHPRDLDRRRGPSGPPGFRANGRGARSRAPTVDEIDHWYHISKFIMLRMTKIPIAIQTPETMRIMCPVLVTNSGMM